MSKKTQVNEILDLVIGKKTIYNVLFYVMSSFLSVFFAVDYIKSLFPSEITNIKLILIGIVFFIIGGIITNKFKD